MAKSQKIDRRTLLKRLAVLPAATVGGGLAAPAWAEGAAQKVGLITSNVCTLAPETTEGPYYFDPALVRQDITEGLDGIALEMNIQVVDSSCNPIENARVDIWHCDAEGNYSGYASQGSNGVQDTSDQTFLRGTQFSDQFGVATFASIYPGWYRSRTTHIHFKVFLNETTLVTSQIFFPDALSQYLFENVPPYNSRSEARDTHNADDRIALQAGDGAFAAIREVGNAYSAGLVVGVS